MPKRVLVRASVWGFVGALAGASAALAHHSFAGIYDSARSVTLEGTVSEFRFVHPHPMLIVAVAGNESWRAEMDNRSELADIGVTADTFKAGDRVRVTGSPGRDEPRILYLRTLERPSDGLQYEQVGSTPRIRWPDRESGRGSAARPPNQLPHRQEE
jgi:hypothetical protein